MNNLEIREFQKAIIGFTNKTDLPIEVKRLCFENILRQISQAADEVVVLEIEKRNKAEQESKKGDKVNE